MLTDVNVQKIVSFFHDEHNGEWKREFFRPRIWDGITFQTEGCTEYRFENQTVVTRAGDLMFLPGKLPYSGRKLSDHVSFYVINFECATPDEFERFGAPMAVTVPDASALEQEISSAWEMWNRQPSNAVLKLKSVLYRWLCYAPQNRESERSVSDVEDILEYIVRYLHDPTLSVGRLCKEFYISESQLRRNLLKATNRKPNEYILALRLQKAESELLSTDKTVKRIAEECGFASPYYFSRCFSEHRSLSPKKFRRQFGSI